MTVEIWRDKSVSLNYPSRVNGYRAHEQVVMSAMEDFVSCDLCRYRRRKDVLPKSFPKCMTMYSFTKKNSSHQVKSEKNRGRKGFRNDVNEPECAS